MAPPQRITRLAYFAAMLGPDTRCTPFLHQDFVDVGVGRQVEIPAAQDRPQEGVRG